MKQESKFSLELNAAKSTDCLKKKNAPNKNCSELNFL